MSFSKILNTLKNAWHSVWLYAMSHKIIATIAVIIILVGGYYGYKTLTSSTTTSYITSSVASSTIVSTLTETGQVSASQQISLSPKSSGEVIGVYVKPGDAVYAGQLVAQLDATDARQSLQNAELALKNAEITYAQTTATSTLSLNLLQAQNAVTNANISLQKTHDSIYSSLASTYNDFSTIVTGIDGVLHNSDSAGRSNQENVDAYSDIVSSHDDNILMYKNSAETSYTAALAAYNSGLATYKAVSGTTASNDDLVALAKTTYATAQIIAEAVKNSHDFYDRVNTDYSLYKNLGSSSTVSNLLSSINSYTSLVSTNLNNALTVQTDIVSAEQSLAQAKNALESSAQGSNALTVQSATLSLQEAKDAVTTAQENLANYSVVAPFAGTIASVGVQKYDQASNNTSVATLVSYNKIATLSVSEADEVNIKQGQKAMLTFDALPDVTIAGTVASISSAGSVSSGVVSYSVDVSLDTANSDIKPGMSVDADIITATADGIAVPNSAIKTSGNINYVLVMSAATPTKVPVTIGITDGTNTIVTSGLTGSEQVVTKTVTSSSSSTSSSATKTTSSSTNRSGPPGGIMMGL